jgi:hypothetical protein
MNMNPHKSAMLMCDNSFKPIAEAKTYVSRL